MGFECSSENPLRLVARLDVKGGKLVKGLQFEGLRALGDPATFAEEYFLGGIDEILIIDVVASLYGRNQLSEILVDISSRVGIPVTVGGGIDSVSEAGRLLRHGADRVAVNTAALARPALLQELAAEFGSQAIVLSVEAKKNGAKGYEPLGEAGRERSGKILHDWLHEAQELGVGEVLLTSIDMDGLRKGFDLELAEQVSPVLRIPFVFGGGFSSSAQIRRLVEVAPVSGVAIASEFHYGGVQPSLLKSQLEGLAVPIRPLEVLAED